MSFFSGDRIKVSTTTSGLVPFGLSTATSAAFHSFVSGSVPDGSTIHYTAFTATEFECGSGVYDLAGATLSRATIYASSAALNAKVNFGSSPTLVVVPLAESVVLKYAPVLGTDMDMNSFGFVDNTQPGPYYYISTFVATPCLLMHGDYIHDNDCFFHLVQGDVDHEYHYYSDYRATAGISWAHDYVNNNSGTLAQTILLSTDVTGGSEDAKWLYTTATAGSQVATLTFGPGVICGAPTGGDKGLGTLNATAVYDDNVLLTCYVWDAGKNGTVDQAYWDQFAMGESLMLNAPSPVHEGAKKFAARLGTEYDPTTLAGQLAHIEAKGHLTPYPNPLSYEEANRPSIGGWVQRGVEMDELLFLYIHQLEQRVAALEAV